MTEEKVTLRDVVFDKMNVLENHFIKGDHLDPKYKDTIESTIITYLKENNLYEDILNESREIPEFDTDDKFFCTCFGVDVYEKDGELKSEFDYAKTL